MNTFQPGVASIAASTVELSISCRNLIDADVFSKSDPMAVLFVKPSPGADWMEYGRTETIDNNLNPEFVKKFELDYFFEERQFLKFKIYDIDSASRDLSKHDFLGEIECTLGEIVSAGKFERPLRGHNRDCGKIIIYAEQLASCNEELTLQFSAKKLDKKDWFGKSDPFLAFYRVNEDNSFSVVHRTEVIKNTLNPRWKSFIINTRKLCSGDHNRNILIKCIDWNRSGDEDLIGEFETNVQELVTNPGHSWTLLKPKKKPKSRDKSAGVITLEAVEKRSAHNFLEFIQHGTQLNCTIAIDFTASNGDPRNPSSLHYIDPYRPNQYATALQAVGEIIQDYDSDKLFPVLGFGARLPPDGRVSHEFFVNFQSSPFCNGINGVLDAYNRCIKSVQLYGPTNFAPIINHVAGFAAQKRDGSEYFILLILTDGVITDMPQTKHAIVNAATLPLSIIIVGIGSADFDAMEELDGDDVRLSSNGHYAARDIVQFVPLRNFLSGPSSDLTATRARLAKEVLAEIPEQFTSYMKANKITPGSWPGARPPLDQQSYHQVAPAEPSFPPRHQQPNAASAAAPYPNTGGGGNPPYPDAQPSQGMQQSSSMYAFGGQQQQHREAAFPNSVSNYSVKPKAPPSSNEPPPPSYNSLHPPPAQTPSSSGTSGNPPYPM